MSFQWTLVAGQLYLEIALVLLLLVPFVSARRWQRIFKSSLLGRLEDYSRHFFIVFVGVIALLFLDAIRELHKYSGEDPNELSFPGALERRQFRLFRAQRNFYISGFALFLLIVLHRLVTLLNRQASLEIQYEAMEKQARSATQVAEQMLDSTATDKSQADQNADNTHLELESTKAALNQTRSDLAAARSDLDAMKSQSASTSREYDRLLGEFGKLEQRLRQAEGGAVGDKKSD